MKEVLIKRLENMISKDMEHIILERDINIDTKTYYEIINHLDEVSRILNGCAYKKDRIFSDKYKPLKEKLSKINSEVNSISEY